MVKKEAKQGKTLYVIEKYQTPEGKKKQYFSIRLINATFSIALTHFTNAYSFILMAGIVHTQGGSVVW